MKYKIETRLFIKIFISLMNRRRSMIPIAAKPDQMKITGLLTDVKTTMAESKKETRDDTNHAL